MKKVDTSIPFSNRGNIIVPAIVKATGKAYWCCPELCTSKVQLYEDYDECDKAATEFKKARKRYIEAKSIVDSIIR